MLGIATAAGLLDGGGAWRLLREGVADVVAWDGPDAVRARIDRWQTVDELVASPLVAEHLVGSSPAWRSVLRDVAEIAYFSDVDVLITGESGTGKELTAQLIHTLDRPGKGDLVVVDCTTIVPSLSGSEFFGHERGAFTGAVSARDGAFALADGGTLFLDEVGELPLALQAELLRAVQEALPSLPRPAAMALHRDLLGAGIRAVPQSLAGGTEGRSVFVLTAHSRDADIDAALAAIGDAPQLALLRCTPARPRAFA